MQRKERIRRRTLHKRAAAAFCLFSFTWIVFAQIRATAVELEANYLRQIGNFMRLSGEANPAHADTFDICVLGTEAIVAPLKRITAGEKIDGHDIRIQTNLHSAEARGCSIVYFTGTEHTHIEQDIATLDNADALTVSDDPDFLQHGGMIQFVQMDNHLRFRVNLDAVNKTHILLGADLLRLAVSVAGSPKQGVTP